MFSNFFTEFDKRKPYLLKDGELNFKVTVIDNEFKNDDNPYGEFKLHRYTSIKDIENINGNKEIKTVDEIIDLKICDYGPQNNEDWNMNQTYYCPIWTDKDFLYGNFLTKKNSWLRLTMHECDPNKRAKENKTCETPENIQKYF